MTPPLATGLLARGLLARFDPRSGGIEGLPTVERRLSDLRECFHDATAVASALGGGDPLVYSVASFEPEEGNGALHYGIGRIEHGCIGDEYFMTRGHVHAWREAAELYVGLSGKGLMVLEDEITGAGSTVPLEPNGTVYVPGRTAHRTVNTGEEPLVYLGIYPASAGHDYGAFAERNFRTVVVRTAAGPAVVSRSEHVGATHRGSPT